MAEQYELVGIGKHQLGATEGWCVTYEKPDGNFHHHMFPGTIFASYAEQFDLDLDEDEDFDEVLTIVLYDGFAGADDPADDIEPPHIQGLARTRKIDRKNKFGRRMQRRAERGKDRVEITGMGIEGIRDRLRSERKLGLLERVERLERVRAVRERRAPTVPRPEGE